MAQDDTTQGQELNTLKQQFAEMQSLLSIPEVRAVLESLREAQTKAGAENQPPPAIDRKEQEKGKAPMLAEKDKSHSEKEKEAADEAESNPSLSLLKGLEDQELSSFNLSPNTSRAEIPIHDKSKKISKKHHKDHHDKKKHKKTKTFKAGDKDIKFDPYNGRRDDSLFHQTI